VWPLRFLALCAVSLAVVACSVYQSPGRKYLEKSAFDYAGVSAQEAQPFLQGCQNQGADSHWVEQSQTADAKIFENEGFQLRIQPLAAANFSCDYSFSSAQELVEKTADAVALTMNKYKETE
jgi:hypothetical protein